MKKLIFLLAFAIVAIAANAQWFKPNSGYGLYTGQAADTAVSGTAKSITWAVNLNRQYLYQVEAEIDELSGSASAIVILYGSNDNSHYYEIDTLATTFTGTEAQTADGTVGLQDLSTGVAWRYLKLTLSLSTTGKWDYNYVICRTVGKSY